MKAITILKRCREAEKDIARINVRIRQWREILDSLSAPQADPNGGSRSTGDPDKNGRVMAEVDQLERERQARQEAWEAEKVATQALLDMVPILESEVLYLYYVQQMDTTAIARRKKYTPGYVRKTKRGGEQLLAMLAPERVNGTLPAWYLKERREGYEKEESQ